MKNYEVLLAHSMSYNDAKGGGVTNIRDELKNNSIGYYPIFGVVTTEYSCWSENYTITQLEQDLLANEANPLIKGHFMHINSGGGYTWYVDRVVNTIKNLKKPIYTLCEHICGSAAYWLAAYSTKIVALTPFDRVGSIGTMTIIMDQSKAFEMHGMKHITVKSHRSDMKNSIMDDILRGEVEEYISKFLDPIQAVFESDVKAGRAKMRKLDDTHTVFRGDLFYATEAVEIGLIDSVVGSRTKAVEEAKTLCNNFQTTNNNLLKILR